MLKSGKCEQTFNLNDNQNINDQGVTSPLGGALNLT